MSPALTDSAYDNGTSVTVSAIPATGYRFAGWSGMLDVMPGDSVEFECEIVNNTSKNFTGANEANDDEMCILVGDSVGAQIPGFCSALPARSIR